MRILKQAETFAYRLADTTPSLTSVTSPASPGSPPTWQQMMMPPAPPPPTGLTDAHALAQGVNGQPYVYGGGHGTTPGLDCTGLQSQVYSTLTGKPNTQFTTDTFDPKALGFQPGFDSKSHYNVGVDPSPGANGHMVGQLGDTKIESSGAGGVQYGGNARGPQDLVNDVKHGPNTQLYHLPNSMITNAPKPPELPKPGIPIPPGIQGTPPK